MNNFLYQYIFAHDTLYNSSEKSSVAEEFVDKKINSEEKIKETPVFEPKCEVLILVNQLHEREKEFLNKILGAIGQSVESVDLLETKQVQMPNFQAFADKKITKNLISFGIPLSKLAWSQQLRPYQTYTFEQINFLLVDELEKIEKNLDLKKALWANLQKLFPKNQ